MYNTTTEHVAIFGLNANPPHIGHIEAIRNLLKNKKIDYIWINPSLFHPFNKLETIDYQHRLNMLKILIAEKFENNNKVLIKELDLEYIENTDASIAYSFNLLNYLKSRFGLKYEFHLALGEDNLKLETFSKFFNYQQLQKDFCILNIQETNLPHSTQIREMKQEGIKKYTSQNILNYILEHKLYGVQND